MHKPGGHCGVSSAVERYPSKLDVVGSIPILRFLDTEVIMSLLSKQDRDLALEALDFWIFNKENDFSEEKRMQINALVNWLKLENFKHEN